MKKFLRRDAMSLDEVVADEWQKDLGLREVPLGNPILFAFGVFVALLGIIFVGRMWFLGVARGETYVKHADINRAERVRIDPSRGSILDRFGIPLAGTKESYLLFLDINDFLIHPELQEKTVATLARAAGISEEDFWVRMNDADFESGGKKILLRNDLSTREVIGLRDAGLSTLAVEEGIRRTYYEGSAFSAVLGYTGLVGLADIAQDESARGYSIIGRIGIERAYDTHLRGVAGESRQFRDAKGTPLGVSQLTPPRAGTSLTLTIDGEFQKYFSRRFAEGLKTLGKTTGVGIALDPQSGEVLALLSFPQFDNETFVAPERSGERAALLTAPQKPLFNRAVSGAYNPGSTIKPLVGIAALAEGVITPQKTIYSPGYLDVPNPYDSSKPSRFHDWQPQGWVNLTSALAKSSNVYFYVVGGGFDDVKGLGITKLRAWWERFHFGKPLGIDLAGEAKGNLPSPEEKESRTGEPWRLGDTFNVSIGQGDFLVTPLQLVTYISAIANKGTIYRPHLVRENEQSETIASLGTFVSEIKEVEKGMVAGTQSPEGTARLLKNLPMVVAAKTGTAQVANKTQENALFLGYGPIDASAGEPQIAILVLIENSRAGSVNTIPIARDVFEWYYLNRIKK